jgi:hypothetical protein
MAPHVQGEVDPAVGYVLAAAVGTARGPGASAKQTFHAALA